MIELGKTQCLNIVKVTDFGVYLGTEEDKVLLPKKQVPDDVEVGDALTVFVYRDSSDRLIATTNKPKIQLGELKRLKVSQVTGIGAFLDWGLEKDLLMPYRGRKIGYNCYTAYNGRSRLFSCCNGNGIDGCICADYIYGRYDRSYV